ncbi:MAG: carbohydrate ABC transporter permease [Clostridia bacterium]|nr:carbohydrate ABC transporter permease [Clostridia bacterium]
MMKIKDWLSEKVARWQQRKRERAGENVREKMLPDHKKVLTVLCIIFILYGLTLLYPIGWMLYNSVKTKQEFLSNPWPPAAQIQIGNYIEIFSLFNLWEMFYNSLTLSLGIPTFSLFATACVAYAVAKYDFPFKRLLYFTAVAVMFIPTTGSLPITFKLINDMGLYDTWLGMIIRTAGGFGFNFLILHGVFSGISKTYAEAAKMDGAGNWRIFIQIMMPQAKATLFAVWILGFIGQWNDYNSAKLFYPTHETLAVGLKTISDLIATSRDYMQDYPKLFAAVIITITPVVAIFIACQKYIIQLNMGGGIKE